MRNRWGSSWFTPAGSCGQLSSNPTAIRIAGGASACTSQAFVAPDGGASTAIAVARCACAIKRLIVVLLGLGVRKASILPFSSFSFALNEGGMNRVRGIHGLPEPPRLQLVFGSIVDEHAVEEPQVQLHQEPPHHE